MNVRTTSLLGALLLPSALLFLSACGGDDPNTEEEPGFGVPENQWTWVDVPGTECGTGTETGIGLNPTSATTKLVIWLQGGGACYSEPGCLGDEPATSNFTGFGPTEFSEFTAERGRQGHLSRDDADNPFKDYSMAFVPYCTGDVHTGDSVVADKMHFKGQHNLKLDIEQLVATFPNVDEVVVTGSSAGGFGAMYNFWLFADAFPGAEVMWIDDSGPLLPLDAMAALSVVIGVWGLEDTIYPECTSCIDDDDPDGGPHNLIAAYADNYPGTRGSLLMSLQDQTIVDRFLIADDVLEAALLDLATLTAPKNPDFHVFYLEGDHHVWLDGDEVTQKLVDVQSGGTTLSAFVQQQIDGDSAWTDVQPADR